MLMTSKDVILDYLAGALSGSAGVLFGHPLDTIKCQLQVQQAENQYRNILECCKNVHRQGLSQGFFRGLSWPLLTYGLVNSLFFGTYANTLKVLGSSNSPGSEPNLSHIIIAGSVGGVAQLSLGVPVEVIKVVLQAQIPHKTGGRIAINHEYYKGPSQGVMDIVRARGIKGMYRGITAQFYRDIPASASYFAIFEFASYFGHKRFQSINSQLLNFISGGLAGVLSWTLIMPFDIIKSRVQADVKGNLYKSFWDCAMKSMQEEGVTVLFRGYTAVAVRAFLVNSVTLMVYVELLKLFNNTDGN